MPDVGIVVERLRAIWANLLTSLPGVIAGVLLLVLFLLAARLSRSLVGRVFGRYHYPENVGIVLGRLSQIAIVTLGIMISLLVIFPGFSVGQFIQILGLGGVGISIAFRDIIEDFVAGIIILLREPFRIGDQIRVDEFEGDIEEITARATYVRTYDNRRVIIPNSELFTSPVIVNTAYSRRRIEYDVGIGYGDDIANAARVALDVLRAIPDIVTSPPPEVLVSELGDHAILLRLRWWITPPRYADALDTRDKILLAIRNRFLEEGIDLPFPTQQVLWHDQTEEIDGDRRRQREGWPAGRGRAPAPRWVAESRRSPDESTPSSTLESAEP